MEATEPEGVAAPVFHSRVEFDFEAANWPREQARERQAGWGPAPLKLLLR